MENTQNQMAQPPFEPLKQKHLSPQPSPRLRLARKIWLLALVVAALIVAYLGIASAYGIWPFGESNIPSPGDGEGEGEVANWKTYRNEEFGFEFKLPSEYEALDGIGFSSLSTAESRVKEIFIGPLVFAKADTVELKERMNALYPRFPAILRKSILSAVPAGEGRGSMPLFKAAVLISLWMLLVDWTMRKYVKSSPPSNL